MKKIAFICELVGTEREGGENIAMVRLAKALGKNGYIVDVYSYTNKDSRLQIKSKIPLQLRLLPFVREIFFVPIIGRKLLIRLEKANYDFIFASSMTIASFYRPRIPLLIVCHLIRSQKFSSLSKVLNYKLLFNPLTQLIMMQLERRSLMNANKIIVIRESQRDYLINRLRIKKNNIHVVPNGIDTKFFRPLNLAKKNQIVFAGRGTIPKGIDTLLQAADDINAKIVIATRKIDPKFLAIAKTKSNVEIRYNISPESMVKLYSESKIFVLPSINEEQPLSTMEAMSCGLPVVVTAEAASNVVKANINGFIIPEREPEALIEKVNTLLQDDDLKKNIGRKNRERIVHNFSMQNVVDATKKILYAQ